MCGYNPFMILLCPWRHTVDLRVMGTTSQTSPPASGAVEPSMETHNSKVYFQYPSISPLIYHCRTHDVLSFSFLFMSSCDPADGSSEGEAGTGLLHLWGWIAEARPAADVPPAGHRGDYSRWEFSGHKTVQVLLVSKSGLFIFKLLPHRETVRTSGGLLCRSANIRGFTCGSVWVHQEHHQTLQESAVRTHSCPRLRLNLH